MSKKEFKKAGKFFPNELRAELETYILQEKIEKLIKYEEVKEEKIIVFEKK